MEHLREAMGITSLFAPERCDADHRQPCFLKENLVMEEHGYIAAKKSFSLIELLIVIAIILIIAAIAFRTCCVLVCGQ
jgi:prepilin-type N-terminal cleavage/methylation domain-containing protein